MLTGIGETWCIVMSYDLSFRNLVSPKINPAPPFPELMCREERDSLDVVDDAGVSGSSGQLWRWT